MVKEIERKFLLEEIPHDLETFKRYLITQNYLVVGLEEIRIREKENITNNEIEYTLCIKRGEGLEREEITHVISSETYQKLASISSTKPIIKKRLTSENEGLLFEIDVYENQSLIVVEVEFESVEEANHFIPPNWFGEEVTLDQRYKNQSLWMHLNAEGLK